MLRGRNEDNKLKKYIFLSKGFFKCEELGEYLKDFAVSLLPMDLICE